MRKLFVLIALLVVTAVASAATVSFQADKTDVIVGDVVSITVIATGNCTSIVIPEILSSQAGLASNLFLNPLLSQVPIVGIPVNAGNVLITGINGTTPFAFPPAPVLAGEVLYSFDYTVPVVASGTIITIAGAGALSFMFDDFTQSTDMGSVALEVIPEPITIALLGLGGLFIRRRK